MSTPPDCSLRAQHFADLASSPKRVGAVRARRRDTPHLAFPHTSQRPHSPAVFQRHRYRVTLSQKTSLCCHLVAQNETERLGTPERLQHQPWGTAEAKTLSKLSTSALRRTPAPQTRWMHCPQTPVFDPAPTPQSFSPKRPVEIWMRPTSPRTTSGMIHQEETPADSKDSPE